MVINCAIAGCKNTQSRKNFSFFSFPKNKFYRDAWVNVCSRNIKAFKHARVCSAHFRPECFKQRSASSLYIDQVLNYTPKRALKLTSTAIPTENLQNNGPESSIVGEIRDDDFVKEYLAEIENSILKNNYMSETVNNLPEDQCLSETNNRFSEDLVEDDCSFQTENNLSEDDYLSEREEIVCENNCTSEITNNMSINGEFSPQALNNDSDYEPITQVLDADDDTEDETEDDEESSTDEESSEINRDVIDCIFSVLPECSFRTEDEEISYLDNLELIKTEINEKMMELQSSVKKERRRKERKAQEIEVLKRQKREQYDEFNLKLLKLKKSKMNWKKECLAYKIRLYYAENKDGSC